MKESLEFAHFVVDLVCVMPPFDASELSLLPKWLPIIACFGSISFLVFLFIWRATKEAFGRYSTQAFIIAFCIAALSFAFLGRSAWNVVIETLYPALVIILRTCEGALLGLAMQQRFRAWHLIIFAIVAIGLYLLLVALPALSVTLIKALWALIGAAIAGFAWTTNINKNAASLFNGRVSGAALFLMFLSTILCLQSSPILRLLFQWMFPVGVVTGIFIEKKSRG